MKTFDVILQGYDGDASGPASDLAKRVKAPDHETLLTWLDHHGLTEILQSEPHEVLSRKGLRVYSDVDVVIYSVESHWCHENNWPASWRRLVAETAANDRLKRRQAALTGRLGSPEPYRDSR